MSVRLSDVQVGKVYIAGASSDDRYINGGLHGVPVVVVAKGKFTTVTQPCGSVIVPFNGDKRTELVVAVRKCDVRFVNGRRGRWDMIPPYVPPSQFYGEPGQGYVSQRSSAGYLVRQSEQEWVPLIIPPTRLRMSLEEFQVKRDAAVELRDAVRASAERKKAEDRKLQALRQELRSRVIPRSIDVANATPGVSGYTKSNNEVTLTLDDFIRLTERANVRGTKTLIRKIKAQQTVAKDAARQYQRDATCYSDAGLR